MTVAATAAFDIDAWQMGDPKRDISLRESCFQAYWSSLPDESKVEETSESVVLHVNGHSFLGRMRLLQLLMFGLGDTPLWERPTSSSLCREWHWLWGYASQLDWQHRSGRLAFNCEGDEEMSSKSWWNYMNFSFSIAIFVAANNAAILEGAFGGRSVSIELDERSKDLVEHDASIQSCIEAWETLFRNGYREYREYIMHNDSAELSDRNFRESRFQFGKHTWKAHTTVIQHASSGAYARKLLSLLPAPEQKFAIGWGHFVEVLAASTFPTDLISMIQDGAGFLPLRVLTDDLLTKWTSDTTRRELSLPERRYVILVKNTHDVAEASPSQRDIMQSFCARVARTESVSRAMPTMFNKLSHGSILVKLIQIVRMLFLAAIPRRRAKVQNAS